MIGLLLLIYNDLMATIFTMFLIVICNFHIIFIECFQVFFRNIDEYFLWFYSFLDYCILLLQALLSYGFIYSGSFNCTLQISAWVSFCFKLDYR